MNNTFYPANDYRSYLAHYGVKGMKWGVRRYQNADGSLNAAGKKRAAKDGVGFISRTKIRMQGATVNKWGERHRMLQSAKDQDFTKKYSARFASGRAAADWRNKSYTEARLAQASRTRLFKHLHNVSAYNASQKANMFQRTHDSKSLAEGLLNAGSNIKMKSIVGRPQTYYGKQIIDHYAPKNANLALDVAYLAVGGDRGVKQINAAVDRIASNIASKVGKKDAYDSAKKGAKKFQERPPYAYSLLTGNYGKGRS